MKPRRYRVYVATFVLMALGALSQWSLLNGHIPFSRSTRIHGRSVLEVPGKLGEQLGLWNAQKGEETGTEIRPLRPQFQTGVVFPQWGTNAYSTADPNWQIGLKDIQQQTGAGWIELPINFYQSSIFSTRVMTTDKTPTVKAVVAGIHTARAKGYHVFVVPFLSVEEVGVLSWSGSIQFASQQQTQAWFDSYWQAFQPYVVASAQAGADELAIGTEFELLQKAPPALWNQLIGRIHAIYQGSLTYDINWSSLYYPLPVWLHSPYLSAIGVSLYVPLIDTPQRLSPERISVLWREKIKKLLDTFAIEVKKPVIISEIGYRDSAYALYHPWYRDTQAATEPVDPTEQAAAYNAALLYTLGDSHISGIFFWAWSMPLFAPNWLPASKILHKWYTSYLA
jgi:hypothetical protein